MVQFVGMTLEKFLKTKSDLDIFLRRDMAEHKAIARGKKVVYCLPGCGGYAVRK